MRCASEWNRPSGSAALVPLPSAVPVTCSPTSMRWSWFPPEVHINTGRLCSAGSGRHQVPRRQRSYAALRLPRLLRPRLRFPSPTAYLGADACSVEPRATGACARRRAARRRWITGSPSHRILSRRERGPPGLLGRPLRACRGRNTPPDATPPRPYFSSRRSTERSPSPSGKTEPSASGMSIVFEAAYPTAHTLAYLRFADLVTETVARLATGSGGLTPGRAGFAPAGRRIEVSWSHRILQSPSTSRAWSHCSSYPQRTPLGSFLRLLYPHHHVERRKAETSPTSKGRLPWTLFLQQGVRQMRGCGFSSPPRYSGLATVPAARHWNAAAPLARATS